MTLGQWSHSQVGGVILHSSWLGAFVNVGAAIDGLVPQLSYMIQNCSDAMSPLHGRLGTISCHVPPGFVNSSDMPEAIKLNVMSSGISACCVYVTNGSVVWPPCDFCDFCGLNQDLLSWFWLDSRVEPAAINGLYLLFS